MTDLAMKLSPAVPSRKAKQAAALSRPLRRDPYFIEGPALISFSGGRTSAYMLRQILDRGLQPDVHVAFANTGKKRLETLDFVQECAVRWGGQVRWIEARFEGEGAEARSFSFAEVDYRTASRKGEPFEAVIQRKQFLPNPVMRFCTTWLKLQPMWAFMRSLGYDHWASVVGLRADEPGRVAKFRGAAEAFEDAQTPLYDAGVDKPTVRAYWRQSPFDLQLEDWEGNCDHCFLKANWKRVRIIRDHPGSADWWQAREREMSQPFRAHGPNYTQLIQLAQLPELGAEAEYDEDLADCICLGE